MMTACTKWIQPAGRLALAALAVLAAAPGTFAGAKPASKPWSADLAALRSSRAQLAGAPDARSLAKLTGLNPLALKRDALLAPPAPKLGKELGGAKAAPPAPAFQKLGALRSGNALGASDRDVTVRGKLAKIARGAKSSRPQR